MRILIFGGAGYVGYELTRQFVNNNDEVAIFDSFCNGDGNARQKINALSGVKVYDNTISNEVAVRTAVNEFKPEVVYNLAALHYIPYCIEHPSEVFATNYLGLQNIITTLRSLPETKLIFASSASVYGSPNEQCTVGTATIPNDIYGVSKLAGEHLIQYQLTNYVIMRLFNVYGELDPHPHLIPKVALAAISHETLELGTAKSERDFVYVKDVANAFFITRNAPSSETYIIATGETHSVKETVDCICSIAQSTGEVRYETQTNMRTKDASYLSGDSSKLRLLGWTPTVTFYEGLGSAVAAAELRNS